MDQSIIPGTGNYKTFFVRHLSKSRKLTGEFRMIIRGYTIPEAMKFHNYELLKCSNAHSISQPANKMILLKAH